MVDASLMLGSLPQSSGALGNGAWGGEAAPSPPHRHRGRPWEGRPLRVLQCSLLCCHILSVSLRPGSCPVAWQKGGGQLLQVQQLLKCPGILFQVPANQSKYHSHSKVKTSVCLYGLCLTKTRDCGNRVVLRGESVCRWPPRRRPGPEEPVSAATTTGERFGVWRCENLSVRGSRNPGWHRPG